MELKDEREVELTREELRSLESRHDSVSQDPGEDAHVREVTVRSLKRMIDEMREDIARRESRRTQAGRSSPSPGAESIRRLSRSTLGGRG